MKVVKIGKSIPLNMDSSSQGEHTRCCLRPIVITQLDLQITTIQIKPFEKFLTPVYKLQEVSIPVITTDSAICIGPVGLKHVSK